MPQQATDAIEIWVERIIDDIASRIRILRAQQGLKQVELAERCNLRQQTISKLENGDYRRNEFLVSAVKVAKYFRTDPGLFLFGKNKLSDSALDIARRWDRADEKIQRSVEMLLRD